MQRSSTPLTTAFAVAAFKETLAVEIETVLLPVFDPLSSKCLCLRWRRNPKPA
ncbi:MAG: hypothetical protein ABSC21_20995 [Terriglobia bacterium]